MRTAIVIDSTFYENDSLFQNLKVHVIPLTVHMDNIVYAELNDNIKQNIELFEKIYEAKQLATTSQPSTEKAIRVYENLVQEGYEHIISLHLSSALSGTFQGMRIAAESVMENNNVQIDVFDTKLAAQASTVVLEQVAEIVQREGEIKKEEVQSIIDYYVDNMKVFFIVDNLDFLSYGGRINSQIASLGNLFSIQPVLTLKDGKLDKHSTVRSKKKILNLIEEEFIKSELDGKEVIVKGVYTSNDKISQKLVKQVVSLHNGKISSSNSVMGIVIANHLGPDAAGVIWCLKYDGK